MARSSTSRSRARRQGRPATIRTRRGQRRLRDAREARILAQPIEAVPERQITQLAGQPPARALERTKRVVGQATRSVVTRQLDGVNVLVAARFGHATEFGFG